MAATMHEKVRDLLKLMHAGVGVRVLPKGTALLEVPQTARGIRRATLERMQADGLVTTTDGERYTITETGRDSVRVLDGVDELVIDAASLMPSPRPSA